MRDAAVEAENRIVSGASTVSNQQEQLAALMTSVDLGVSQAEQRLAELSAAVAAASDEASRLSGETGPALVDVIAGRAQMIFSTMPPALPHVKSGKLRALATTAAKRDPATPDVPTVAESGVKGFEVSNWQGIVTQAKVPPAIVGRLHAGIAKTLALPAMAEALTAQGLEPTGSTPQQFAALIRSEIEKYRSLVKAARIVVD